MVLCACNNVDPNFIINFMKFITGCRLLTGAILAHELMHGWLRLKGDNVLLSLYSTAQYCLILSHSAFN